MYYHGPRDNTSPKSYQVKIRAQLPPRQISLHPLSTEKGKIGFTSVQKPVNFSLFRGYCLCALYCFGALCCLARSLFYVTGEFHRFLHRG